MRRPAHVLSDLFGALATLMAEVNPADQNAHNAEIAKVKDQITQANADLAAEYTRMAAERAALDAQAYRLTLDQSASNDVMRRRYRSHLPPVYEARNLFDTPGAGTSNQPVVNRVEAPGTGAPVQLRPMDPPRQNNVVVPHVPTPPGHYSNPVENMIATAARLAALLADGDSPTVVETRRVRDLLQTALEQHEAYSYSRDKIHSTPRSS